MLKIDLIQFSSPRIGQKEALPDCIISWQFESNEENLHGILAVGYRN